MDFTNASLIASNELENVDEEEDVVIYVGPTTNIEARQCWGIENIQVESNPIGDIVHKRDSLLVSKFSIGTFYYRTPTSHPLLH